MQKWGPRIAAAIGMAFIWGAAWFVAGLVVARVPGFYSDLPFALLFAPVGFVAGVVFSGILGGPRLGRMSYSGVALSGAVSGLLLSAIFPALRGEWREFWVFGGVLAMASAVAAAASLTMARRAERRELSDPTEDAKPGTAPTR